MHKNHIPVFISALIVLALLSVVVGKMIMAPRATSSYTPNAAHTDPYTRKDALPKEGGTITKEIRVQKYGDHPQFVVLAFDGSRSLKMWQATRDFAKEMASSGAPLHFTYFINAVYLLDPAHYALYQAPGEKAGVSNIGFATSKADVQARIDQINGAIAEGHEIGSHNAGHFTGDKWNSDEWKGQLTLFNSIVYGLGTLDGDYKLNLKRGDIVGFRAPDLAINTHMYEALRDMGYRYDTSKVAQGSAWPVKDVYGIWQFALPTLRIKDVKTQHMRYTIGMDYSLYVLQTGAHDRVVRDTPEWQQLYDATLNTFTSYFNANYQSNHAPVYMANHFSAWNDGVYFEAMKTFAKQVCGLKDVHCISFRELADYMDATEGAKR